MITEVLNNIAEVSEKAVYWNFLVNFVTAGSLNTLWSTINAQQIIVQIPLVEVPLPANTVTFLEKIYQIASFDIYPGLGDDLN